MCRRLQLGAKPTLTRRSWGRPRAVRGGVGARARLASPAAAAEPLIKATAGYSYYDVKEGVVTDKDIGAKTQVIVDYEIRRGGFDGPAIETARPNRMPFLFTVGTGAVNRAIDDAVRGMKPGGTRRLVVPAKFDKGIDEEDVVQMRAARHQGHVRASASARCRRTAGSRPRCSARRARPDVLKPRARADRKFAAPGRLLIVARKTKRPSSDLLRQLRRSRVAVAVVVVRQ